MIYAILAVTLIALIVVVRFIKKNWGVIYPALKQFAVGAMVAGSVGIFFVQFGHML